MKKTTVRKNGQLFEKMDILEYFLDEPEREFHLREIAILYKRAPRGKFINKIRETQENKKLHQLLR